MSLLLQVMQGAAGAFFIGLWVLLGWADFRRQKIRNSTLSRAAAVVACGYGVLFAMTLSGVNGWLSIYPAWGFYRAAFESVALCAAAGLALWQMGVWPAGDAKLFALLAALYPLTLLAGGADQRRLFLAALINIFIPASVAVFFRAGRHVFSTRLMHRRDFLLQLGWKRELDFVIDGARESAGKLPSLLAQALASARQTASSPFPALWKALNWALSMLALSIFSSYARNFFTTPLLLTALWGAVFLLWSRVAAAVGTKYSRIFVVVLAGAILLLHPPARDAGVWRNFLNISIFSVFFGMGSRWTMMVLTGSSGAAYALTLLLPFVVAAVSAVMGGAFGFLGSAALASTRTLLTLSGMGVFFGLSLVLVRLWDHEVLPSAHDALSPYVVLAPRFIERMREDPEFFEEHFSRLYADGLTAAQAQALRAWCAREGIETVPLTPTISFAVWIFLGFFLTRLLNGTHVVAYFL